MQYEYGNFTTVDISATVAGVAQANWSSSGKSRQRLPADFVIAKGGCVASKTEPQSATSRDISAPLRRAQVLAPLCVIALFGRPAAAWIRRLSLNYTAFIRVYVLTIRWPKLLINGLAPQPVRTGSRHSAPRRSTLAELAEECCRILEVGGVESLSEPAIDRCQQSVRVAVPPVIAPQASQAHRGAQLE